MNCWSCQKEILFGPRQDSVDCMYELSVLVDTGTKPGAIYFHRECLQQEAGEEYIQILDSKIEAWNKKQEAIKAREQSRRPCNSCYVYHYPQDLTHGLCASCQVTHLQAYFYCNWCKTSQQYSQQTIGDPGMCYSCLGKSMKKK